MKKSVVVGFLVLFFSVGLFADYDKDAVVKVMRANGALFGQLNAAAGQKNFALASEKLTALAAGMRPLLDMTPPKGSKEDWDKDLKVFIDAADRGNEACKKEDAAALQTSIAELRTAMQQGHKAFR